MLNQAYARSHQSTQLGPGHIADPAEQVIAGLQEIAKRVRAAAGTRPFIPYTDHEHIRHDSLVDQCLQELSSCKFFFDSCWARA